MEIFLTFSIFLIFLITLTVFRKVNFLEDTIKYSKHKSFVYNEKKPIIIGGIYLFSIILFFFPSNLNFIKYFSFLILIIGLLSDSNFINNPTSRFFLQVIVLLLFIIISGLNIQNINIPFFDQFLLNYNFNIFFTVFCFLVLMNGNNFLDGLNVLVSGYYLIISLILYFFISDLSLDLNKQILFLLIITLTIFVLFNFFGYCLLGDSGTYLLGFIYGYILIGLNNDNYYVSPYFIVLLLWFPAFENLFSLLRRKFIYNKKLSEPDNLHLHQLIYLFIKNKNIFKLKFCNSLTSLLILFYNFFIFLIGIKYYYHTKILSLLIIINIINYILIYFFLKRKLISKKK